MSVVNLCREEKDFIRDVPDPAGNDSQCHSREDVGVVSLAREEGLSTGQGYLWEWTPTCKYCPALIKEREKSIQIWQRSQISAAHHDLCSGDTGDKVAKPQSAEASPPEAAPADTLGGPTPPEAPSHDQGHAKGHQAWSVCLYCKCSDLAECCLCISHLWSVKRLVG